MVASVGNPPLHKADVFFPSLNAVGLRSAPSPTAVFGDTCRRKLTKFCAFALGNCLVAGALIVASPSSMVAAAPVPITRIEDVRDLTAEQAGHALPVRVRGVVTWKTSRGITIQDGEFGTWLHLNEARAAGVWKDDSPVLPAATPGDILEVEGFTIPGAFAPGVMPAIVRLLGHAPVPSPRPMEPARFFSGADDGIRVEVRGVIQGVRAGEESWILRLDANPGIVAVEFPLGTLTNPERLVDAEVRVIGIATTRFNTRGEMTMPRVFGGLPDELIVEKPGTLAFDAPFVPLSRILPYRRIPLGPHRLRVAGTVTFSLRGRYLYLQDGDAAVRVETRSTSEFQPGDRVEASGFGDTSRYVGGLVEAQVRKVGAGKVPATVTITPQAIVRLNKEALNLGLRAQPHDYDGHLIKFAATLLAVETVETAIDFGQVGRRLALVRDGEIEMADLIGPESQALDHLALGSEIEVTGIVRLEYTPVDGPRSGLSLLPNRVWLILRSPRDVTVVRAPSWWTPTRLLAAVAVVALALVAALLWIGQLRRRVRAKTAQLAVEIRGRRDAVIEFQATLRERNRLAANLHDTLLQTLGGLGFELGACEAEAGHGQTLPLPRMRVARRILDLAVTELRNSVWALRTRPLAHRDLGENLRAILEHETSNTSTKFLLRVDGDISGLPDFLTGNLVLAVQEAVRNAVRHGLPRMIELELFGIRGTRVRVVIADDGLGFVPGEQLGPAEGHFGLVGLRERIERLDGSVTITSTPGKGTRVELEIPIRSYDETVA